MARKSPSRVPVDLDFAARFDAGYTLDVKWNHPARSDSFGGWFFFNTTRIQVLVNHGKTVVQDVGWSHAPQAETFHEDGRFVLTTEEIGQLMGGN